MILVDSDYRAMLNTYVTFPRAAYTTRLICTRIFQVPLPHHDYFSDILVPSPGALLTLESGIITHTHTHFTVIIIWWRPLIETIITRKVPTRSRVQLSRCARARAVGRGTLKITFSRFSGADKSNISDNIALLL